MKKLAIPILAIALTFSACTDNQLEQVAKSLLVAAKSIGIVQTTVIEANKQGLITDETTSLILAGCIKANQAGQQASAITRSISKLDPASRQQMIPMVQSALGAVSASLVIDLSSVKNEQTKQAVLTGLTTAQTALNLVLTTLSTTGN